jgi:hypothetical protein
MLPSGGK